jgi:hypothetical protein
VTGEAGRVLYKVVCTPKLLCADRKDVSDEVGAFPYMDVKSSCLTGFLIGCSIPCSGPEEPMEEIGGAKDSEGRACDGSIAPAAVCDSPVSSVSVWKSLSGKGERERIHCLYYYTDHRETQSSQPHRSK